MFFWPDRYFQLMTSPILNPEIQYKMQNQRKCYFLFIVWMSLTNLCNLLFRRVNLAHAYTIFAIAMSLTNLCNLLRPFLDNVSVVNFFEFVFRLWMGRCPQTALWAMNFDTWNSRLEDPLKLIEMFWDLLKPQLQLVLLLLKPQMVICNDVIKNLINGYPPKKFVSG